MSAKWEVIISHRFVFYKLFYYLWLISVCVSKEKYSVSLECLHSWNVSSC